MLIRSDDSLKDAMRCIDAGAHGIALVIDDASRLIATVTDGDIRRAVLAGDSLEEILQVVLRRRNRGGHEDPVSALINTPVNELLALMRARQVRQVPLLNDDGHPVDLVLQEDLLVSRDNSLQAVVMAGGFGRRLAPLTHDTPKPMLPIGGRPILRHLLDQLKESGIHRIHITTHYKPEMIEDYFGDGSAFGLDIQYVREDEPLGTAGAISLLERPTAPLLVLNGDVLTRVNYMAMLDFHREYEADLTVAMSRYEVECPFGVLDCDGPYLRAVREKPTHRDFISAGIYLLNPSVHGLLRPGSKLDMPELIERSIADRRTVVGFPILDYWLDIGQPHEYRRAEADMQRGVIPSGSRLRDTSGHTDCPTEQFSESLPSTGG